MGWLSLATKVIPKLWKGGKSVAGAVTKNPKTSASVAIATFAGWDMLTNDGETFGTAVGKTIRGASDKAQSFSHDVVNGYTGEETVEQVTETTTNVISDIKGTVSETKGLLGQLTDTLSGISNFLGNLFGGNGTNMFGNFFNNLASGKVSGLGIGALIASAYLIFGRTGLLGKIGGLLMGMLMIGNNSRAQTTNVARSETQERTQGQSQDHANGMRR